HADVEGDAGARRRAVEDHGESLAGQRLRRIRLAAERLQAHRLVEDRAQCRAVDRRQIEEMEDHHTAPTLAGASAARPASIIPIPASISFSVTISGGSRRTTLSPAPTDSSPALRKAVTMSADGTTQRMPRSRAAPRTSATRSGW